MRDRFASSIRLFCYKVIRPGSLIVQSSEDILSGIDVYTLKRAQCGESPSPSLAICILPTLIFVT